MTISFFSPKDSSSSDLLKEVLESKEATNVCQNIIIDDHFEESKIKIS